MCWRWNRGSIGNKDHFIDDLGGDSLSSLGVFSKAEEVYDVIIPDTEYFTCTSVDDLSMLLYRKIHNIEDNKETCVSQEIRRITTFEQSREYEEFATPFARDAWMRTSKTRFLWHMILCLETRRLWMAER